MAQSEGHSERHNGGANPAIEQLRSDLGDVDREVRNFVRENPLLALGIAIAAGYVVGRVLAKL
jgi:hypothetical protein